MAGDASDDAERQAALDAIRERQSSAYDRALLTLSAGAFTLSLLFYERIAPEPAIAKGWLVWAWAMFGISIFTVLWSFHESEKAIRKLQDWIDDRRRNLDPDIEDRIECLNVSAGLAFGLGVVLLFVFASCNLLADPGGQVHAEDSVLRQERLRGAHAERAVGLGEAGVRPASPEAAAAGPGQ